MQFQDRFAKLPKMLLWASVFLLLVLADQLSKAAAEKVFINDQFAFSLPLPTWLMYAVYALVLFFAGQHFARNFSKLGARQRAGWLLVWSGAVSNLAERLATGYVRDWVYLMNGVFNLADGYILLGVIMLLLLPAPADGPGSPHNQ